MKRTVLYWVMACLLPAVAVGQTAPALEKRLTLDAAIRQAAEHNRQLQTATLQVQKAQEDLAAVRTRRLPQFETNVFGSQLLTPVKFSFPQGAFGTFPGIGPVPAANTEVSTKQQPTVYLNAQVSQPLTQLRKIGLSIRGAATTVDMERQRAREQQLEVVNAVKRLYFEILQTESGLTAGEEVLGLYKELDRTLQNRVLQKVALQSDSLDVQYRLAQAELAQVSRRNTLASQKEQLNQLLGRDVRTAFDLEGVTGMTMPETELGAAQARALESRPDVRQARLSLQQAELDWRVKKTDRIPEVSVAVSYSSNLNMDVLPQNLASFGIQLKWEPFDWGRRSHELASKTQVIAQARHSVRDAEDRAVVEINSRFRKLSEARAQLAVVEASQRTAREKLRVTTSQYQLQAALLSDVLRVRAELADTDDRYQQALMTFWTAKADFDQALGEEGIQ